MASLCGADCGECMWGTSCRGCEKTCGKPFGGDCLLAKSSDIEKLKNEIIIELGSLGIPEMKNVSELYALPGFFINLEYTLDNGQKVKLFDDSRVYLGCQLEKQGSDRCYGVTADENHLLVCEYGENGSDPEIVIYKRRK